MPTIARIIGGAGTGKTTELLNTMDKVLSAGVNDPLQIGFVSFTRAARREASERAGDRYNVNPDSLEDYGWFKTLHAVCYRCLGVGKDELLVGNAASRKWIAEAIGEPVEASDESLTEIAFEGATDTGRALRMWDAARNRLVPLAAVHAKCEAADDRTPSLEDCRKVVEHFEQAKRLDGRSDFVDLLGRFAGWRFGVDGHEQRAPQGDVPEVPVWFLDEQQDVSALLDSACRRLIAPSQWVYVVGDPFQAIYGWAGADAKLFMGWEVAKQRIMPKSYRCPPEIHNLGEEILQECSDYWDRGIAPADHEGEVDRVRYMPSIFEDVEPTESWLLLSRTNMHAAKMGKQLDRLGIPWLPTKGNGGWNAPARNEALEALWALQSGLVIRGSRWKRAIEHLPAKLLERGVKTRWAEMKQGEADGQFDRPLLLGELPGATPELVETIASGKWRSIVDHGEEWCGAVERWGEDAVKNPKVRVGTIHSVKGMEADNVLWLTTLTNQVRKGREDQDVDDEERRLAYVAVTRARKRLVVAVEPNSYRFEVPL